MKQQLMTRLQKDKYLYQQFYKTQHMKVGFQLHIKEKAQEKLEFQ
jgi:hypothetical protein